MEIKIPTGIAKFGKKQYLKDLQEGKLYMNSWDFYKNIEDKVKRDVNEGVDWWFNPDKSFYSINGYQLTSKGGTINASLSCPDTNGQIKIFCASGFYKNDMNHQSGRIFGDGIRGHGESVLLITNVEIFCKQLVNTLERLQNEKKIIGAKFDRVEYYNEHLYDGKVGPFRKSSRFDYESEWRIAVKMPDNNLVPYLLEIGSIDKISILTKTKDFRNEFKIDSNGQIQVLFD